LPRTVGAKGEALVAIFRNAKFATQLVFRGGTALHKLHIRPAAR
jgi:predicted nucleotidyltransferase component of viral defense system